MNQVKKLFTILLFACYIIAADKSYKIVSTDIQSFIKQDGSIDFIEKREFKKNIDFKPPDRSL